ncbi:hypothetical protein, partial [Mesorhizobium sp. M4B.F.Ca.ET.019.03.1.1]|uniref:hypothetical protein n=1 Tax=Mesorhizobium sp. M4B.F.Ca.ET.019.03.1.1 TaxID=2496651 RepID=UPI001AEC7CD4
PRSRGEDGGSQMRGGANFCVCIAVLLRQGSQFRSVAPPLICRALLPVNGEKKAASAVSPVF